MEIENLIEELDYQTLKDEIKTQIKQLFNNDLTFIESDSFSLIVEAMIYREMQLRARINQAIRDAFEIIDTDDTNNTAGAEMAYIRAIRDVEKNIKDIKVYSEVGGVVEVVFHDDKDLTVAIQNHLDLEHVRPLTDLVHVRKANVITLDLSFTIFCNKGANTSYIKSKIDEAYSNFNFKIGQNLSQTKALSLVHQFGVYRATTNFRDTNISSFEILKIGNINCTFEELI